MAETARPPVPRPAERAKTIAARGGPATLTASVSTAETDDNRVSPILHHVHSSGTVSLLLPETHPLVVSARERDDAAPAMILELTDHAPVPLREPVRGLVWITGLLSPLPDRTVRERAVRIAEDRPDPRLLDVGHGTTILRLSPASLVLSDAEGTHTLRREDFTAAGPDPFHDYEGRWLRHLETDHADVVTQLRRHVPRQLRDGQVHSAWTATACGCESNANTATTTCGWPSLGQCSAPANSPWNYTTCSAVRSSPRRPGKGRPGNSPRYARKPRSNAAVPAR